MGTEHLDNDKPTESATTEEILAEARRRVEDHDLPAPKQPNPETARRLNRGVYWFATHWVGVLNVVILLYVGGAILAPVLMHLGLTGFARALYAFYKPFCHQYPFRSWFLYSDSLAHPLHEPIPLVEMNALGSFLGSPEVGYKMALCQRDIAIYGMMYVAGVVYGLTRKSVRIPPLPLWLYFVFGVMPMMLDGGIQWLSYAVWQFVPALLDAPFETIPAMRALTGALFGLGVIGVGYPYLGEYFDDVLTALSKKYGW